MMSCNHREPSHSLSTEPEADDAWDVTRAAGYLGIKPGTLYKKAAAGLVPSFKVFGALRFSPRALFEWRKAQQAGAEG